MMRRPSGLRNIQELFNVTACTAAVSYTHLDVYNRQLWEKLRNGASLMYTWNIGLGSDFVSVFAYSSPTSLAPAFPFPACALHTLSLIHI